MIKVTQLGNSRAKELNSGSLTPEPAMQTSPLPPTPDGLDFSLSASPYNTPALYQPSNILFSSYSHFLS